MCNVFVNKTLFTINWSCFVLFRIVFIYWMYKINLKTHKCTLVTRIIDINSLYIQTGTRGGVVVKALRYKPAGRGFDTRWCHWNFSVT